MSEPIFRLMQADDGAQHLIGFAKKQVRRLLGVGLRSFTREWKVEGATARVSVSEAFGQITAQVWLIGGGSIRAYTAAFVTHPSPPRPLWIIENPMATIVCKLVIGSPIGTDIYVQSAEQEYKVFVRYMGVDVEVASFVGSYLHTYANDDGVVTSVENFNRYLRYYALLPTYGQLYFTAEQFARLPVTSGVETTIGAISIYGTRIVSLLEEIPELFDAANQYIDTLKANGASSWSVVTDHGDVLLSRNFSRAIEQNGTYVFGGTTIIGYGEYLKNYPFNQVAYATQINSLWSGQYVRLQTQFPFSANTYEDVAFDVPENAKKPSQYTDYRDYWDYLINRPQLTYGNNLKELILRAYVYPQSFDFSIPSSLNVFTNQDGSVDLTFVNHYNEATGFVLNGVQHNDPPSNAVPNIVFTGTKTPLDEVFNIAAIDKAQQQYADQRLNNSSDPNFIGIFGKAPNFRQMLIVAEERERAWARKTTAAFKERIRNAQKGDPVPPEVLWFRLLPYRDKRKHSIEIAAVITNVISESDDDTIVTTKTVNLSYEAAIPLLDGEDPPSEAGVIATVISRSGDTAIVRFSQEIVGTRTKRIVSCRQTGAAYSPPGFINGNDASSGYIEFVYKNWVPLNSASEVDVTSAEYQGFNLPGISRFDSAVGFPHGFVQKVGGSTIIGARNPSGLIADNGATFVPPMRRTTDARTFAPLEIARGYIKRSKVVWGDNVANTFLSGKRVPENTVANIFFLDSHHREYGNLGMFVSKEDGNRPWELHSRCSLCARYRFKLDADEWEFVDYTQFDEVVFDTLIAGVVNDSTYPDISVGNALILFTHNTSGMPIELRKSELRDAAEQRKNTASETAIAAVTLRAALKTARTNAQN